jgi:sugar phosphate isomerase/epimerase
MPPARSQLSVITDEISQDLAQALDMAQRFGVTHVELRSVWGKNICQFTDDDVARVEEELEAREMAVACVSGPVLKCPHPLSRWNRPTLQNFSRSFEYNLGLVPRIAEIARVLKTTNVRVMNCFRVGRPRRVTPAQWWDAMLGAFRQMLDLLSPGQVALVENEHVCNLKTLAETRRFFEDLSDERARLLLDPGNYASAGEYHAPADYAQVVPLVAHMHVKDPIRRIPGLSCIFTAVGEGKLDYRGILDAFSLQHFSGFYSLETHAVRHRAAVSERSLRNMRAMLGDR